MIKSGLEKDPEAQSLTQNNLNFKKLPGEGNGNLLQYSCLEYSMDRGAWGVGYSPWSCKQSDSTEHTCRECTYIINKNLLYNAGNSTQYSIMAYVGKESLKK